MIRLYNTLSRAIEDFQPLETSKVKMYVCGPTVYGLLHIGNGRTFMFWDVARRYLVYRGYEVTYVQNFTDIDDKIIQRAVDEGTSAEEVAETYTRAYFEDMDALGVERATHYPRATAAVPGMISHIEGLIAKGMAYAVDGDVYFRVRAFPDYGKLSGRTNDQNEAGARVDVDPRKEDPSDFALWKAAKPGEPAWSSPWGQGRPGWHIECSAMVREVLGDTIDIHAGGMDLKFPHHENEIAQSEALTGRPYVRFWMHTGFLNMGLIKMSKSIGNIKTTREMVAAFGARALRVFLLSTHYRQELDFSEEAIRSAETGWNGLTKTLETLENLAIAVPAASGAVAAETQAILDEFGGRFQGAMDLDFNTPKAIAHFHLSADFLGKRIRQAGATEGAAMSLPDLRPVFDLLREQALVLGLDPSPPPRGPEAPTLDPETAKKVDELIASRAEAKGLKEWSTADQIRKELVGLGIQLIDHKDGTTSFTLVAPVPHP